MLVDEVEPEEAVAVHASGVAEAGEDVPGGGDGEEEEGPVRGLSWRQLLVFAGEGEVDDGGAEEEDEGDQAFGEDGEGEGCPHEVGVSGGERGRGGDLVQRAQVRFARDDVSVGFEGLEEAVEGGAEEEGEQDFGDEERVKRKTPAEVRMARPV